MGAIAGMLPARRGRITVDGMDVTGLPAHERVRHGLALVPEGRRLFVGMTVAENLAAGAYRARGQEVGRRLDRVFEIFPSLAERRSQQVGTLSGGEQQMCAIGRALMSGPTILLIDELSLGLAPVVVDRLLDALVRGARRRYESSRRRPGRREVAELRRPGVSASSREHRDERRRARAARMTSFITRVPGSAVKPPARSTRHHQAVREPRRRGWGQLRPGGGRDPGAYRPERRGQDARS